MSFEPDLSGLSAAIVVHGAPTGPPAIGLKEYLVRQGADVRCLYHPLNPEQGGRHVYERFIAGRARTRVVRLPSLPPYTYPLDLLLPFDRSPVDVWFGFDNLSTARGLFRRGRGAAHEVVHWAVDFVPDRFGDSVLTAAYDAVDRLCCRSADLRIEVTPDALEARTKRLGLGIEAAPAIAVPIGLWADETEIVPERAFDSFRAVFVGHLVERMGVATAIEAVARSRAHGREVPLDIVGEGPLERQLRDIASDLDVGDLITFHGFQTGRALDSIVAGAAVALAPYKDDLSSFTRYADPSKLKTYLAAGLPIVLTPVPPNANELAGVGCALLASDSADAFADAIGSLAADRQAWLTAREAALSYARAFDWPSVLDPVLSRLRATSGAVEV